MAFVKALSKSEVPAGKGKTVTLEDKTIAIFNVDDQFLAIDDLCSHAHASLADGTIIQQDGRCMVECPWHGALFDLKTGAAVTLPAVAPVKKYAVRVVGDTIEVEI